MTVIIDAEDATLGRLSSHVAKRLLNGEEIIVVNSEKAIVSGKKTAVKKRYKQKKQLGTHRKGPFFPRTPDRIVKRTIRGMIPYQKPHGRKAFKNLKCYTGIPETFQGKKLEKIKTANKEQLDFVTVKYLSKYLGDDI